MQCVATLVAHMLGMRLALLALFSTGHGVSASLNATFFALVLASRATSNREHAFRFAQGNKYP